MLNETYVKKRISPIAFYGFLAYKQQQFIAYNSEGGKSEV